MGCLHVYTGEGKGKTSAAFGAAFRAFGRDHQVFIAQFLKHEPSGEVLAWEKLCCRPVALLGAQRRVGAPFTGSDADAAVKGWVLVEEALHNNTYDLVVLDELCVVLGQGLLDKKAVIPVLLKARDAAEIIVTGRYAPQELLEVADLVTEFSCIKHYATKGVPPRRGVEF